MCMCAYCVPCVCVRLEVRLSPLAIRLLSFHLNVELNTSFQNDVSIKSPNFSNLYRQLLQSSGVQIAISLRIIRYCRCKMWKMCIFFGNFNGKIEKNVWAIPDDWWNWMICCNIKPTASIGYLLSAAWILLLNYNCGRIKSNNVKQFKFHLIVYILICFEQIRSKRIILSTPKKQTCPLPRVTVNKIFVFCSSLVLQVESFPRHSLWVGRCSSRALENQETWFLGNGRTANWLEELRSTEGQAFLRHR